MDDGEVVRRHRRRRSRRPARSTGRRSAPSRPTTRRTERPPPWRRSPTRRPSCPRRCTTGRTRCCGTSRRSCPRARSAPPSTPCWTCPGGPGPARPSPSRPSSPRGSRRTPCPTPGALAWYGVARPSRPPARAPGRSRPGHRRCRCRRRRGPGLLGLPHPVRVPEALDDRVDVVLGLAQPVVPVPVLPVAVLPLVEVDPVLLEPVLDVVRDRDLAVARGRRRRRTARRPRRPRPSRRRWRSARAPRRGRPRPARGRFCGARSFPRRAVNDGAYGSHAVIPLGFDEPGADAGLCAAGTCRATFATLHRSLGTASHTMRSLWGTSDGTATVPSRQGS